MGGAAKKEFRPIGGVPVLALAIRPFLSAGFDRIVVTLPAGRLADAAALLAPFLDVAALTLVEGGDTRQESVRRGLLALAADPPDLVLIHDGARPWLATDLLARVLESAERYGACVPVVEVAEAVKELEPGREAGPRARQPGRRFSARPATPAASPPALRADAAGIRVPAHRSRPTNAPRAEGLSFVDDAEVFDRFAGPVAWVTGDPANRKITFPDDLEEAP